jgi:hypothetical protein
MDLDPLNIACLTATYGRPALAANVIACFLAQSHPAKNRRLLILDDAAQICGEGEGWKVWSTAGRYPTLPAKYNALLSLLADWWPEWEAVAIWDDDDVFGPESLSSHAEAMTQRRQDSWVEAGVLCDEWRPALWSHPLQVRSLYGTDRPRGATPIIEPSGGRFWSASAVRRTLLERMGGFIQTGRCDHDQQHLAAWQRLGGAPGRPDAFAPPQYVYGWGRSNHCSGRGGEADWYTGHRKMDTALVGQIIPVMDEETRRIYAQLWTPLEPYTGTTPAPPGNGGTISCLEYPQPR